MACRTELQIIDDIEYGCTQYPATQGMIFKFKVIKSFGESLAILVGSMTTNDTEAQLSALSLGISKLFNSVTPEDLAALINEMLTTGSVSRDGKKLSKSAIDEHFSGDDMASLYKLFVFVLKVNYAGFFKGKNAQAILAKAEAHL